MKQNNPLIDMIDRIKSSAHTRMIGKRTMTRTDAINEEVSTCVPQDRRVPYQYREINVYRARFTFQADGGSNEEEAKSIMVNEFFKDINDLIIDLMLYPTSVQVRERAIEFLEQMHPHIPQEIHRDTRGMEKWKKYMEHQNEVNRFLHNLDFEYMEEQIDPTVTGAEPID